MDFDTKQPIAGAAVSGSQDILLGLGPDYVTRAKTDRNGRFFLNYLRLDSSIYFGASSEGYSRFECWYHHDRDLIVRLKKRISPYTPLRQGAIHLRLTKDGKLYGWNFSERRMTASEDSADVLPTFIDSTTWGSLRVKALGKGGIKFVSQDELGVDHLFLIYTDTAPLSGYEATAEIKVLTKGGVYFVRTRDGKHFAKIEFNAFETGGEVDEDVERDVMFQYVYNDLGSRDLRYQSFR